MSADLHSAAGLLTAPCRGAHAALCIPINFQMRCTLIWLLLCILCCAVLTSAQPPAETLAPFDYLNGQLIDLDTGVKLYKLADLKPSTAYEVRLSFPASVSHTAAKQVPFHALLAPIQHAVFIGKPILKDVNTCCQNILQYVGL